MRTATVRLSPPGTGLHPADAEVAARPDLGREAIDHITALADGAGVVLCRLRGDAAALADVLADTEGVLDSHVTDADGTLYAYVHFRPTETAEALLELRRAHELVVRTPIRWLADGRLEVSAVGDDRTLQAAVAGLPDAVGVELVELREYDPSTDRAEALLTDRQLEVLDAALDAGYYEQPRRANQADVAEAVGLAPATVGEHLRRIEGTVMRSLRE
ncbi:helix-turn-helix domain-containing protein [Natronomonas marina]|jgi:predicted DNA binding protein|uniref:helix-turn-helix domain-containing protein n=1 Tax=Natronomonas marina TaxID=2961939 RepID=UPI0020C9537B|nr:helix-turn-helix domain-containing protein [Natronomonas marina]